MPHTVNSRVLTSEKPCINKGFLVMLMHRKLTFNMIVPGPLKLFRHILFTCHNTIIGCVMDPLKKKKKKENKRPGFEPCFLWETATLPITLESRFLLQRGTIASNTYHYYTSIDKLRHHIFVYTSSCRVTELKIVMSSYFYDVKLTVKQL